MVAQQEMAHKIGIQFEFTPSRKAGKAVTELRFEVKSIQELINEDVAVDLLTAQQMQPHEIAAVARNLINNYKFTRKQQNQILENLELMDTFIRLHLEIHHGKRVVKNATAYMAQSLGFGKPSTKTTQGKVVDGMSNRSRKPQRVAEVIKLKG